MARLLFEVQAVRDSSGDLADGVTYSVYTDEAATTLADIAASSGGASIAGSTVTVADIAGLGPAALRWWGPPAGTDLLYLKTAADPALGVQKVEAASDPRLDALEAAGSGSVATHNADTTFVHGIIDTSAVVVHEPLTQAVLDAKQAAGEALRLAAGTHTVASVLDIYPSVPIIGEACDKGASKGTYIQGTAGQDVFRLAETAGDYSGYHLAHLKINGGRDQLVQPGNDTTRTYVTIEHVEFAGPSDAGILIDGGAIEEWYLDDVRFEGGIYGFRKVSGGDADTSANYIDKTTFKDCIWGGQSKSGFWADTPFSNTVTFLNPILNLSGEHGFYWRGGSRGVLIVNPNTEQCGTSGKKNRTTLSGTVSAGATSGTLASATGWATGDQITIAGAGASGADFEDTVTISGTTATWTTPTSTTVSGPKVTNAKWDEFHFATIPSVSGPAHVTVVGGIVASEAALGRLRYSVRVPGAYVSLVGVSGGTGNDIPAYVGDTIGLLAVGGNLRLRALGREYDTSTAAVMEALALVGGLQLGADVSLARSAANTLKTEDSFIVGTADEFKVDVVNKKVYADYSATSGSSSERFAVYAHSGDTGDTLGLHTAGGDVKFKAHGSLEMPEISDPAAPTANNARLYVKDNGSGKTQLVVRFPSGAVQTIATEP